MNMNEYIRKRHLSIQISKKQATLMEEIIYSGLFWNQIMCQSLQLKSQYCSSHLDGSRTKTWTKLKNKDKSRRKNKHPPWEGKLGNDVEHIFVPHESIMIGRRYVGDVIHFFITGTPHKKKKHVNI